MIFHSFVHSGYLYSAPSRNLLRGVLMQSSNSLQIFRPTIANISVYPVKLSFIAYIFFQFFERARATLRGLAGHFWPAGHILGPLLYRYWTPLQCVYSLMNEFKN